MEERERWVAGDGGPLIVLQASAAARWHGAADFEDCLMYGGSVRTDYDIICECMDEVGVLRMYDRDMLVLSDSEWSGRMFTEPSGDVVIVQSFYRPDELPDIVERAAQSELTRSLPMQIEDEALRLVVGADDGDGGIYGHIQVPVTPGAKRCDVYAFEDGIVARIKDA